MQKETISIKLNCTPEIYRIIMRRQAREKEKRCRVFSLEAAALKIIEESEIKQCVHKEDNGKLLSVCVTKNKGNFK